MSLYNALFGVNPFAGILLSFLGTAPDSIPRFRDCYVDEKGRIVIHTRTGGGNRDYYESEDSCRDHYPEYFESDEPPSGPWNADLRALPGFLYDEDDDFDCTYADFYFQPSGEVAKLVKQFSEIGAEGNPGERWQKLFADMEAGRDNPQVARALEVGKPIIEGITAALGEKPTE